MTHYYTKAQNLFWQKSTLLRKLVTTILALLFFNGAFSQCFAPPTYCTPTTTNINNYQIGLQNVTLGTSMINNSTSATGSSPNYFDYTSQVVSGAPNSSVSISITNGSGNSTMARIFIDYNQDGTFSTSSPELVWTSGNTTAGAVVTGSFTIPSTQAVGQYRIRVTGDLGGGSSGLPCQCNYGEQEDYSLVVTSSTKDASAYGYTSPTVFASGNNTIAFSMFNLTNATMSSVDIGYKLDNNSAVTQSLSSLSVAAGGRYVATFSTQLNISSVGTYTLKMWLNNVNGGGTQTAANDTICRTFIFCNPLSGNYTIDPSGSGSTNFLRFGQADTAMINCGISGPVVFTVAAATYNEQITIPLISGVSATNTITFDGGTGNATTRILTYSSTAAAKNYTVNLAAAKFIRFKNMSINATNTSYGTALGFTGNASNDSFYNVIFNGISTSSNTSNLAVIYSNNSANISNNIRFDTCTINNGAFGSFIGSSSTNSLGATSQGTVFNNCNFNNQYVYGMYFQNLDGIKLTNNRITTNSALTTYTGIYNYWIMVLHDSNKTVITGNKISGAAGGYGIYCSYVGVNSSVSSARRYLIANNFIQIGSSSNAAIGLYANESNGNDFIHNSINVGTSQSTNTSSAAQFISASYGTNTVQNNIFSAYNGAPCIRVDNFTLYPTVDYNQYYTAGANLAYIGGSAYTNFSSWKSGSAKDANSINVQPTFTSNTDLHISAVCNNGTNLSSLIGTDIDGLSRPTTPDMGADENTSSPASDVGVVAMTSPVSPVTAGSQTLKALVKNHGTSSVSSLQVSFKNNGGAATAQTFNFSPALAQCDTSTVTFTSNITIAAGTNNVKVYTDLSGDAFKANDTAQNTLCTAMTGSYTINPGAAASTTNFQSFGAAVSQMLCGGLSGAVTFTVSNGTYNESFTLGNITGNSSTNTITFTSASSNPALCILQGLSTSASTVFMGGADYVTFNNMGFLTSTAGSARNVEFGGGSNNNTFNGCIFNSTISTANYHIYEQSVVDNFNTFTNNTFNAVGYAMYMSTNGTRDQKWVISGNTFNNQYQAGVYLNYSDSINILNNTFTTSSATTYYAMYIANAGNLIKATGNNITLSGAASYGIYFTSVNGTTTNRIIIANNAIRGGVNGYYHMYIQSCSYIDVYHNTLYTKGSALTSSGCLYFSSNNNFNIKNNIFNNMAGGYAVVVPAGNTYSATNVINYNNYKTSGTNIAQISAVNQTTYANFVSAMSTQAGTTQNANSNNSSPLFVSAPTNLNIADGCITGTGSSTTGVTTSINNVTRSTSTANMGAYEFASLSDNLMVVAIRTPISTVGAGLTNVVVTIKNVGNNSITSGTIKYQYDNNTAISLSLPSTMNPCDTLQITFNSTSGPGATDQRLTVASGLHYLKAFTASPNGNTDNDKTNDTTGFTTCTGGISGLNFTINPSAAASASNFISFTSAITAITGCGGISGPVKFTVAAGTYTEQIDLTGISGLSATNTLTFDGGTGNAATRILQASGTSTLPYTIRINNLNYISIKNLTIRGNGANAWPVHILAGTSATTDTIKNCIIDFGSTSVASFNSTNYMGIVLNGNATSYSTVGTFSNIVIDSNTIGGGYANIMVYANNTSSTGGNQFTGNTCNNAYQYGVFLQGINGGTFDRNTINMNTNLASSTGLYLNSANALASTNAWSIQRNKITNAGLYGIYLGSTAANASSRGKMYNNLIGGGFRSTSLNGIYFASSAYNWDIFHNTVNLDFAATSTSSACIFLGNCCTTGATTLDVRNNIFAVTAASSAAVAFYMPNGYNYAVIGTSSINYNLFYINGANSGTTYGYNAGTLLTASTVLGNSSYNTNSIIGNPFLYSNTDLHIGITSFNVPSISGVGADYSGTARGSSTDVGAYETPTPNNEIGISAITSPAAPFSAGSMDVVVTIKNYGANTLTSANVSYTVNGGSPVSVSLSSLSIAAGGTGTYTFTGANQITVVNNTNYIIKAYTSSPNGATDAFMSNDTFTTATMSTALCGNYTIDQGSAASSTNFTSFSSAAAKLATAGVSCATTFTVVGTTAYTEQADFNTIPGLSATNTVTITGGTGNAANRIIQFAGTASLPYTIRIANSNYISIKNLTIRGTSGNAWPLQFMGVCSNDTVQNCIIDFNGTASSSFNSTNYMGIVMNGNANTYTNPGAFANIVIDSNTIPGGYANIMCYSGNSSTTGGNVFSRNTCTNAYQYGIYISGINGGTIDKNIITMYASGSTSGMGISLNSANALASTNTWSVSRNKILNAGQIGIYLSSTSAFSATVRGAMYNNLIGGGFTSTGPYGLYITGSTLNWDVYHNTINLDNAATGSTSACIYSGACCTGNTTSGANVSNNILAISNSSSASLFYYFVNGFYYSINNTSGGSGFDYNVLYKAGAVSSTQVGYDWGVNVAYSSLIGYAASSNGVTYNTNSILSNPFFTSSTDLHIGNAGNNVPKITAVASDYDGTSRGSTTDAGAYEAAASNNDIGISAITVPTSPLAAGNSNITVTLKNFGANTVTSANVSYIINGGSAVSVSLSSISLAANGGTGTYTFSGGNQYNFAASTLYVIKAYTTSPNGVTDAFAPNDTFTSGNLSVPLCGNYTINQGAAASSTNFTSFTNAASVLNAGGVSCPVYFTVMGTTAYNEQVELISVPGASTTNTITFDGGAGNAANRKLTYSASNVSASHTFRINNTPAVTLRNLTIVATGSTYGWPVHIYGNNSDYCKVKSCIINYGGGAGATTTGTNFINILINNSTSSYTGGTASIDATEIDSNTIDGGYASIWDYGYSSQALPDLVTNNTMTNAYQYGMYFYNTYAFNISRNTITGRSSNTTLYGLYLTSCFTSTYNSAVSYNTLYNCGQYGIYLSSSYGNSTTHFKLHNNMIGGGFNSASAVGLYGGSMSYWDMYYNTINMNYATTAATSSAFYGDASTQNNDIRNNVFAFTSATGSGLPLYLASTTLNNTVNYNNYYNAAATNLLFYNSSTLTTANYTTSGGGANSKNINPSFTSATNLRHATSTLKAGITVSGYTDDIDGHSRSSTPYIGAYEVPQANDLAANALLSPSLPTVAGTFDVTVKFKNVGSSTVTSGTVGYKFNNNAAVTTSYSGSLTALATTSQNFTGANQITISSGTSNTLKIFAVASGDGDNTNDTLTYTICAGLNGTYTIDTTQAASASNFKSFGSAVLAITGCGGISGPVVFNVSANTYNEQINITAISGISSTNTVTFNGSGTSSTVLSFATTNANNHVVRFNSCQYVNFRNMAIKSSGTTDGWILHFYNAKNCNISKCLVEFTGSAQSSGGSNLACIVMNGSTSAIQTSSATIDNINIDSSTINYGYYNAYMYITGGTNPTIRFRNDSMTNAYYTSIYMWLNTMYHKILNNKISLRSGGSGQFGIWSWAAAGSDNTMYSEISNNKFTSLNGYGIALTYGGSNGAGSVRGQIYNNIFGGNTRGATNYISGAGAACCAFNTWNIYHNTIYMDYGSGTSYGIDMGNNSSGSLASIKNNIFYNASTTANNIGLNLQNSAAIGAVDYNEFYTNYAGGTLANIGGTSYTASNIKGAYPSGAGTHTYTAAVNFTSSTNYHHSTGCLLGQTGLGITTDYDGATRNSPPDVGAYNVSGIPASDIGVSSITTPSFPVSGGSQLLKAVVQNYGTNAVTSMTVYRNLNSSIDSQTFTFSPALNSCDTATVTFTNNINIVSGTNVIKVYTALSGDATNTNDTAQSSFCIAYAGNYTINQGAAASSTNFQSFGAALTALACGGVSGPVVFTVMGSTPYNEQVDIGGINGSSATNTITFDGGFGNAANRIITYNSTSTNFTVRLNGASYMYFKNLTITAQNTSLGTALTFLSNARYDTFYNVIFNGVSTTSNSTNMAVIYSPTSSVSHNMSFDTCRINNGYFGSYIMSSSSNSLGASSQNLSFNNCDFTNQYGYGMYHQYLDGIRLTKNRITTNSSNTNYYGMYNYWIMVLADANKTVITRNKISGGQGGFGMYNYYLGVNSTITAVRRYMIADNFIQIGAGSNSAVGLYDYNGNGCDYIYNSVNLTNTQVASTSQAAYFAGAAYGSNTIQNNIFAGTSGAAAIRMDNNTYYPTCNYNSLSTVGSTLAYYSTTGYTTIGTWRTASSRDANSITTAPSFVSASDLHITNKACLDNLGTNLSSLIGIDIDSNSRSSTPDMGASEFTANTYDIAMRAIISPNTTSISTSTNYTISVKIKNNATAAVSNVIMNYDINGSVTTQTFTPGSAIQPCDSITFSFATTATFPSGTSTLKIYSTTINSGNTDQDHTNDTIQNTYCTPYSGTLTINPAATLTNTNFANFATAAARLYNCGISGSVIVEVSNGVFNENVVFGGQILGSSPSATVTFRPASGDTGVWINSSTAHTIALNGAKYITFDGRPGGAGTSRVLNISNSNTTFAAIQMVNDAVRDTIRYCNLYSNAGTTLGTVYVSNTSATIGNDSNTVEYCQFDKSTANPAIHFYALGTAGKENDYFTVRNNNFLNAYLSGSTVSSAISTQGNNRYWNILNNNFTYTSICLPSGAVTTNLTSILINAATEGGHLIQGNRIGGSIPGISGSVYQLGDASVVSGQLNQVLPIRLGASSTTNPIKIYSNILKDMKVHSNYSLGLASGFLGILVSSGNVEIGGDGPSTGNVIGDSSLAANIEVIAYNASQGQRTNGIRILGGITTLKIKNNIIGGLAFKNVNSSSNTTVNEVIAIQNLSSGANSTCYIDSNFIGSNEISNSIQNESGSYGATLVGGIQANPSGTAHILYIRSNNIRSLLNGYSGSSVVNNTFGIVGGSATSIAIFKIDSNNISYMASVDSNVSTGISASMIGIALSSGTSQANPEILRNRVSNMSLFKGNTSMYGIFYNNTGTGSVVGRNKVYALSNGSATGTFTNISGIYNSQGNGVTIANNQISLIQASSSTNNMIGISDYTSANTQNYHYNSVYIGGAQSGINAGSAAFGRAGTTSTLNIRNNIFYNEHTSSGTNYLYTVPSAWSSTTSQYNFFASADTSNAFYVSGTATTYGFGGWVANVSDGSGTTRANKTSNVISSNFFADAANDNLNIKSDYCEVNARGAVVATTSDIDGETRNGSTPDIGADEFNMDFDLGVSSIKTPTSGLNRTSTEVVKVWVKNYSSTVSVPSATNFKAGFMLNAATIEIRNFTTASAINVGDSQLFTFTSTANVGAFTTHTMKAWTQICDANSSNDSVTSTIINQLGDDIGVIAMLSPGTSCTYGPNQTVSFKFKNFGYDTVKMATNAVTVRTKVTIPGGSIVSLPDATITSGQMLHGDSITVIPTSTFNMSTTGNYIFKSYTIYSLDNTHINDTLVQTIAVVAPLSVPYVQDFNASTSTPSGWTLATGFAVNSGVGAFSTNGIRVNNNTTSLNGVATLPKVGSVSATSAIQFDYRITNVSGGGATTLTSDDSVLLQISTDCGVSYSTLMSINSSNHSASTSFVNKLTSISAYNGQNVILKVIGKTTASTTNNYYLDIDNVNVFNQASMSYVSSTVTQNNQTNLLPGTADAEILGLTVVTSGNIAPLAVNKIRFSTTGTTNASDVTNAKIYYTSNNNIYSTSLQVGSTVSNPSGYIQFNLSTPLTLSAGNNYFWLSYSISSTAAVGNRVDASVDYVTVGISNKVPSPQTITGNRMIYYCAPVYSNGCGIGYISGVQLGTINNTNSGCSSIGDSAWSNYYGSTSASLTTSVRANNNYTLKFTNSAKAQKVAMWIDYNRNGIYETSEYSLISSNVASGDTINYNLIMPSSVVAGTAGMRIRTTDTSTVITSADACATFANGEAEDYKITLLAPCDWIGGVSTLWSTPANWASNSIPLSSDNVKIPSIVTTYMPTVVGVSNCRNILIDSGATITIITGGMLNVQGTYNRLGSLDHQGGAIVFYLPQSLPADTHALLAVNGAGTYTMLGNTKINIQLVIGTGTTLNDGGNIVVISKDIMNNGIHTGTGKMMFAGAASQTIAGSSNIYKNIELVSAFSIRAVNNMTVTGNLGLTPGTLTYQGVNFNLGTTASTDSIAVYGIGNLVNTTGNGILSILGDTGAAMVVGLRVQTKAPVYIHRPKGVRLGGDMTCDGILTLDTGVFDINGYSATIGTINTATSGVTTGGGSLNNSVSTAGLLSIYGNATASAINNLKMGSQYRVSIWRPAGISLGQGCNIYNLISLTKGFVNLNGYVVTLGSSANIIEGPGQTFRGSSGSLQISTYFASALSNTNIGSLGLVLSTNNNPGTVTISRYHDYYTNGSGGISIKRNYNISASNSSGLVASTMLITYDSVELNGSNRNYLRLNRSTNGGSTFTTYNPTVRSTGNAPTGWVAASNVSLSTTCLVTLSDSLNSPLRINQNTGVVNVASNLSKAVKAWPVPFNNTLTIELEGNARISIYDMEGKLVMHSQANGTTILPTENLPYGVYTLRVESNTASTVLRVVKQ